MLRLNYLLLFLSFVSFLPASGQPYTDSILLHTCSENTYTKHLPASENTLQVVHHSAYSLGYSEPHEQAAWVCYVLSTTECTGEAERRSSFYADKAVLTGSAGNTDYKSSGYDRGHLAPAGDMSFSETAMKESFYYSNVSPQVPSFNRGIWSKLEAKVRSWGITYGSLLVLTGPVFTDTSKTIGPDSVTVPAAYYKIVVNAAVNPPQSIGFLLKNAASKQPLETFVVTIDSIEVRTGIDFLPDVPDTEQAQLENHVSGTYWNGFANVQITPKTTAVLSKKKKCKHKHR